MQRVHPTRFPESSPSVLKTRSSSDALPEDEYLPYSYESSTVRPKTLTASGMGATALISAGILALAVWVSMLASHHQTNAANAPSYRSAGSPATHNEEGAHSRPALHETVTASQLGLYHWKPDCPLATAQSLREDGPGDSPRLRGTRLSRRQAELGGYRPCPYCEEIEYWRIIRSGRP